MTHPVYQIYVSMPLPILCGFVLLVFMMLQQTHDVKKTPHWLLKLVGYTRQERLWLIRKKPTINEKL